MKRAIVMAIRAYKKLISPLLPGACRFYPSCSSYCAEAVEKHGLLRGLGMGLWRILRCNQLCKGGFDPVR